MTEMTLEERIAELFPVFEGDLNGSSSVNEQVKEPIVIPELQESDTHVTHMTKPDEPVNVHMTQSESVPLDETPVTESESNEPVNVQESQSRSDEPNVHVAQSDTQETDKTPKKPKLPSRFAQKQAEFERARELEARAKGKKVVPSKTQPVKQEVTTGQQMKRVLIAGKWKMVPVTEPEVMPKQVKRKPAETTPGKKVPYASIIKQDAIKRIEKNATSIAELQRIQYESDLADLNTKDISVRDLRRLRQQKLENDRLEAEKAKKDTLINQIMRDNTKSEFSKLLQIKKLSQGKGYPRQ